MLVEAKMQILPLSTSMLSIPKYCLFSGFSFLSLMTVGGQKLHKICQAEQTMKSRTIGELGFRNRQDIWKLTLTAESFRNLLGVSGCLDCFKKPKNHLLQPCQFKTRQLLCLLMVFLSIQLLGPYHHIHTPLGRDLVWMKLVPLTWTNMSRTQTLNTTMVHASPCLSQQIFQKCLSILDAPPSPNIMPWITMTLAPSHMTATM